MFLKQFKKKVVVITGGGAGIGRALGLEFLSQGAHVMLIDIHEKGLEEMTSLARGYEGKVTCFLTDISDRIAVEKVADEIFQQEGRVDILINNAGVTIERATATNISWEQWAWMMNINFWGALYCIKYFRPYLERQEAAHIVNISSVFGLIGAGERGAYSASKFALRGLTECMIQELRGTPINVTLVIPGGVSTDITLHSRGWKDPIKQKKVAMLSKQSALTSPEQAAKLIIKAIKANRKRLLIGLDAIVLDRLVRYFPVLSHKMIHFIFSRMEERLALKGNGE